MIYIKMRGYSLEKICYRVPIYLAFMNNPKKLIFYCAVSISKEY